MLAITRILSLIRLQVQRVRLLRLEVRLEAEGAHRGVEDDEARGERRPVRRIFVREDVDDDVSNDFPSFTNDEGFTENIAQPLA